MASLLHRSPGPRVVNLNPPEIYPMTSDADDDLQEPQHATTAHSFEESFDARLDAGGMMTSRAGGKERFGMEYPETDWKRPLHQRSLEVSSGVQLLT